MMHLSPEPSRGEFIPLDLEPHSPESLTRRLARVPPEDQARGYFFQATLEQVRLRGSDGAVRRCLEASGVEAPVAFFKYPLTSLLRMLYQATWELMGDSSFESTLYGLGRHVCAHFLSNPVGKSFLVVAGRNPRQLVEALPAGYRTAWDHGWVSLEWDGPRHCRSFLHAGLIPPPYIEGVLQHVFEAAGVVRPRVRSRSLSLSETAFDLTWD